MKIKYKIEKDDSIVLTREELTKILSIDHYKTTEIKRLNNIINELEKYMRYERINNGQIDEWTIMEIQMKLKELKGE